MRWRTLHLLTLPYRPATDRWKLVGGDAVDWPRIAARSGSRLSQNSSSNIESGHEQHASPIRKLSPPRPSFLRLRCHHPKLAATNKQVVDHRPHGMQSPERVH